MRAFCSCSFFFFLLWLMKYCFLVLVVAIINSPLCFTFLRPPASRCTRPTCCCSWTDGYEIAIASQLKSGDKNDSGMKQTTHKARNSPKRRTSTTEQHTRTQATQQRTNEMQMESPVPSVREKSFACEIVRGVRCGEKCSVFWKTFRFWCAAATPGNKWQ